MSILFWRRDDRGTKPGAMPFPGLRDFESIRECLNLPQR
jgi:hypothetical protein